MKKNFADQPTYNSGVKEEVVLNATNFNYGAITGDGSFSKFPIFVDNCKDCGMNTKKNFNLDDAIGLAEFGVKTWSDDQQRQAEVDQANLALQIEQQRAELERQKAQADIIASQNKASVVKSYALPIAIGGGVIILGIATYFLVKK